MKKNYVNLEIKTKPLFKFESPGYDDPPDTDPTTITTITFTTSITVLANSFNKSKMKAEQETM